MLADITRRSNIRVRYDTGNTSCSAGGDAMPQQSHGVGQGRAVKILIWIASIVVALGIGLAGVAKFASPARWQQLFLEWGYPGWFLLVVGTLEIAGGVSILIPRVAVYGALVLGTIMLGAIGTLLIHPTAHFPIMLPAIYVILLVAIATARVRARTHTDKLTRQDRF